MRKFVAVLGTLIGAFAIGSLLWKREPSRWAARDLKKAVASKWRSRAGKWRGISYRLAGHRPDPDSSDLVLADRIRSELGPFEKRLDLPRLHVMVNDHVARLHGAVDSGEQAAAIEEAVHAVSGVDGVESFLHVGLDPCETRPSEGRAIRPPSGAMLRLLSAVRSAGADENHAELASRCVLSVFVSHLPDGERGHLLAHLPADIREWTGPPRILGFTSPRIRSAVELVAEVIAQAEMRTISGQTIPVAIAEQVTFAVLGVLKGLVPEEVADVSAVLPHDLRRIWESDSSVRLVDV